MELPIDYATLRLIWWGLLGVLLIAFALTDGFDLGVGALLPFIARTDEERRMVINTVGVSFSSFYMAMFLVLGALILRPVAFKYRSKRPARAWRSFWDWALFVGGFVPALVFGVAVGNVLIGAEFRLDSDLRSFYEGSLLGLFTPFSLLCGLLSVAMLVLHGAGWLGLKAERGPVAARARALGTVAGLLSIVLFVAGGLFVAYGDLGFRIVGVADPSGVSNPLRTAVVAAPGAWLDNYGRYPWMIAAPVMGLVGVVAALFGLWRRSEPLTFAGSAVSVIGIISTVGLSMFPFILPSTIDPVSSLTVWNSSSTHLTLFIMLGVTAVFLPLILVYTAWVYRVLWGRSSTTDFKTNPDLY